MISGNKLPGPRSCPVTRLILHRALRGAMSGLCNFSRASDKARVSPKSISVRACILSSFTIYYSNFDARLKLTRKKTPEKGIRILNPPITKLRSYPLSHCRTYECFDLSTYGIPCFTDGRRAN